MTPPMINKTITNIMLVIILRALDTGFFTFFDFFDLVDWLVVEVGSSVWGWVGSGVDSEACNSPLCSSKLKT